MTAAEVAAPGGRQQALVRLSNAVASLRHELAQEQARLMALTELEGERDLTESEAAELRQVHVQTGHLRHALLTLKAEFEELTGTAFRRK